jgi:hypothetical protein
VHFQTGSKRTVPGLYDRQKRVGRRWNLGDRKGDSGDQAVNIFAAYLVASPRSILGAPYSGGGQMEQDSAVESVVGSAGSGALSCDEHVPLRVSGTMNKV